MNRQREPQLVEDAREAVRRNPGYVAHGPEVCPRDIIAAFELGVASAHGQAATPGEEPIAIRNPLRTLKHETARRLADLAADLECGLNPQETILTDWTSRAERAQLDPVAAVRLACLRLADGLREALGAAEPRDLAAAGEIAEQMAAAADRLAALAAGAADHHAAAA